MRDLLCLDRIEQAETLFKPQRVRVLRQLAEPRSCREVGERLEQSPQRVYYHVKRMLGAGLVAQVGERRVRGVNEGVYQASARSYWLSPKVVGAIGGERVAGEMGVGTVLDLVEDIPAELAALGQDGRELPALGLAREVRVPRSRRQAFLDELRASVQQLLARYGDPDGDLVKLVLACYPGSGEEPAAPR
ncbi:Helix-turn-helix domain-containing protein [Amycolatopsis arida]|uniref:Helix-turn-helix domain-containing protein n=1 Tax=Amycolatopsis arida TaxID=587909 RepID=A0A1I5P9X4_9PSEU|nr:helix-turn-helix domain-containing protein [Amycolatopsis arida]TDX98419.1 helix-turn-helix protein [Amycolatopsis arida]SFP30909.1 Helix-turn-helix domain-containing protein [Amycolatopsis arida]